MVVTLENINEIQRELGRSVVVRSRLNNGNTVPKYILMEELTINLSIKSDVVIPKGFIWDLSSVPRPLWGILPPDGDFELSSLIHDYLYRYQLISRKFADDEMLLWSKVVSGTQNKWSLRNLDNQVRYIAVRIFGAKRYNKNKS